jgi:hypothetical protein
MDARRELTGNDDWLTMDVPATCQRIQMNCGVSTDALTLGGPKPRVGRNGNGHVEHSNPIPFVSGTL